MDCQTIPISSSREKRKIEGIKDEEEKICTPRG
jgi:hypothetical protein